jgi:hypothetical protein
MNKEDNMKYYIAGPMTNMPQFNYPYFDREAKRLRDMGYEVVSPAELDDPETRKAALASSDGAPGTGVANGETWGDFLARDVKLVADKVDGIAVLDGWQKSRGARLETYIAHLCGKPIVYASTLKRVPQKVLERAWLK